jgi:hypothetical protein
MLDPVKERRKDKQELYKEIINAGGVPARGKGNMFHCFNHNDATASSWIKQGREGYWYFRCFTCNFWMDVWDLECRNRNITFAELVKEKVGELKKPAPQYYYNSIDELVESLEAIEVEEVNPYTNPDTGNLDLVTIRYLGRGEKRKQFSQAYQTPQGLIKRKPQGLLPLFNRVRLKTSDTIIFVEGEKAVRRLAELGIVATTGSGGSSNASAHDYSPLSGKTVVLWADNDEPGCRYMEDVRDKLLELEPIPTVMFINISDMSLPQGGDVVDVCEKVIAEGGNDDDCKNYIESLIEDSVEVNRLDSLESLLDDMREGRYVNLEIQDFPLLTNEASMLLNKRIGVIYGSAGFGKSLFIGKACDDLVLAGHKVARLQLEDELEQHLLRSFAQQSLRAELANPKYHITNPMDSKALYEQFKPSLDLIASTVVAGEHDNWDYQKILNWIEVQLKLGKELIVVDPISVVMTKDIWITSHRLMWGTKKLLAQYPNGRVVFVSHNNTEGEVAGGQSYKRFCHTLLMLNRFKKPKSVNICNNLGEMECVDVDASIGIVKARYGRGSGLEIAVRLNPETLCIEELGVILSEVKKPRGPVGRDLEGENASFSEEL